MSPGYESRPGGETGAAGDRWAATDSDSILRLTATVLVDLDHRDDDGHGGLGVCDLDREDRHALDRLSRVPSGARVRVNIGSRHLLTDSAVRWLHKAAQRLEVELLTEDAQVAYRWHRAILRGELS